MIEAGELMLGAVAAAFCAISCGQVWGREWQRKRRQKRAVREAWALYCGMQERGEL
jgi:hypothetical protein